MLQNLRLAMRRQMRRHTTRRTSSSSSSSSSFERHLGHLWSRLSRTGGRVRGHAPLQDPPGPTQIILGLHSYHSMGEMGAQARSCGQIQNEADSVGIAGCRFSDSMNLQPCTPESPASPLSSQSADSPEDEELSPVRRGASRTPQLPPPTAGLTVSSAHSGHLTTLHETSVPTSRKLVFELAVNCKGVSLRRYSPVGPLSPVSPPVFPGSSQTPLTHSHPQSPGVTSPTESLSSFSSSSSSSVKTEDSHLNNKVPRRKNRKVRKRDEKKRLSSCGRTLCDERGDSGREDTPS